jgi:uncharacterized CHY-type Zn-finger protein
MNSTPNTLYIQKKVTIFVQDKLTFNDFKQYNMKEKENESEQDFNERCKVVWNTLCEKADKYDVIQVEDENCDDDYNRYDCEQEIEELIEEAEETK